MPSRALHVTLWVLQALLALLFLFAGTMKLLKPGVAVVTLGVPTAFVIFLGSCEIAGGLGLILPSLLRIRPKLTPLAAVLLAVIMAGAVPFDLRNGRPPITIVLGLLLLFIAWGRYRKAPI